MKLGNLSKTLIKAPHYFNNNIDTEPNQYSKLSKVSLLDTFSNIRKVQKNKTRYFKEKDFMKKNLIIDLNYNNNFRNEITPKVRTRKCMSFEEFFYGNNFDSNNSSNNIIKQNLNKTNKSNLTESFNSKFTHFSEKNQKIQKFFDKTTKPAVSTEEFNTQMKVNINNLIGKLKHNSLNFNENKFKKLKNRIENLKDYINKNNVVEAPIKLKFPEIKIKSNDILYRDAMDKKINSLSMLKPKIKEQLKSKNRVYASRKDYYRFNNSYYKNPKNPFYESVNYVEGNKKKEKI